MDAINQENIPTSLPNIPGAGAPAPKRFSPLVLIVSLLAVAIVAGIFYRWHGSAPQSGAAPVVVSQLSQAKPGGLVPGFPRELIFGKDAQVIDSRTLSAVKTATGTQMFVARYTTSLSRTVLYNAYIGYANDHHYPIQRSENGTSSASVVFGNPDITIANIVSGRDISDVTVTVNKNIALPVKNQ